MLKKIHTILNYGIKHKCLYLSHKIRLSTKKCQTTEKDFVPVFYFPYIRPFAIINRLKFYQTILTAAGIPLVVGLNQANVIGTGEVQITIALGLSGCLTLYGLGYFTNNLIGIIYYNDAKDLVRISYADFWGQRKELELPTNDIIPMTETQITYFDSLYSILRRYSTNEIMRVSLRYGVIMDNKKFKKIL